MPQQHPEHISADMRPPSGSAAPTQEQRLANTGTTESTNATALTDGAMATLLVGAVAVRVAFLAATGGGSAVETTDPIIGAYQRFDWKVSGAYDDFVAIQAADGASAYEAWVWTSSGPR
jgi:hypothetical protein